MMQPSKFRSLYLSAVAGAFLCLAPQRAHASEEFPGALQEAAGMPCTPSCVVCHGKTPGDLGSFTARKLPRDLVAQGVANPPLGAHATGWLKASYAAYAAKAATDPAIKAVVDDLKAGVDPETKDSLCGPTYGCGAHVAKKAPPRDLSAPLWVAFAMTVGALFRRRQSNRS